MIDRVLSERSDIKPWQGKQVELVGNDMETVVCPFGDSLEMD